MSKRSEPPCVIDKLVIKKKVTTLCETNDAPDFGYFLTENRCQWILKQLVSMLKSKPETVIVETIIGLEDVNMVANITELILDNKDGFCAVFYYKDHYVAGKIKPLFDGCSLYTFERWDSLGNPTTLAGEAEKNLKASFEVIGLHLSIKTPAALSWQRGAIREQCNSCGIYAAWIVTQFICYSDKDVLVPPDNSLLEELRLQSKVNVKDKR